MRNHSYDMNTKYKVNILLIEMFFDGLENKKPQRDC